jgi:hypothetical protein
MEGPVRTSPAAPARGRLGGSDCERLRPGLVAQPVNTVTSLGYALAGGIVLATARGRGGRPTRAELAYSGLLGLVGLGSVAFHGPQPPGARLMHDAPIPVLLLAAVATPAARVRRGAPALPGWSQRRGAVLVGLSVAAASAYLGGRTDARTCDPDSVVQLHGAWHLLSAAAFVVLAGALFEEEVPSHG